MTGLKSRLLAGTQVPLFDLRIEALERIDELEGALQAMRGAFDTPIARRKDRSDFANEARNLARACFES